MTFATIDFRKKCDSCSSILGEKATLHLEGGKKNKTCTYTRREFGSFLENPRCCQQSARSRDEDAPSCSRCRTWGEDAAKSQWVKLLLHVSAGNRLWSRLWIGPLHTDYFKALIIHQGRREAKREEVGKKKSLLVLLSHTDVTMHTGAFKYAELGLAPGNLIYIYKALHYFLQLAACGWCAHDVGFVLITWHEMKRKSVSVVVFLFPLKLDEENLLLRGCLMFPFFINWNVGRLSAAGGL